jgi:hypothetical protein
VFEEAVQGLVQICFPGTVLDELGIEIVAAHMQHDNAPQANVERMRSAFKSAMIPRVAWMLAQYTDSAEKLENATSILADASRVLHGQRQSQETVDDTSSIGSDVSASSHGARESSEAESISTQKQAEKSRKKGKNLELKSKSKKKRRQDSVDNSERLDEEHLSEAETVRPDNDGRITTKQSRSSRRHEQRLSASWRWHVDSDAVTVENIPDVFQKMSDLFAYHALPVVQQKLEPTAKKKDPRKKIQSALTNMSNIEYRQWVDSLQNLRKGDLTMLDRVTAEVLGKDITRATPAPTSRRLQVYDEGAIVRQQDNCDADVIGETANPTPMGSLSITTVEKEHLTDMDQSAVTADGVVGQTHDVHVSQSTFNQFSAEIVSSASLSFRLLLDVLTVARINSLLKRRLSSICFEGTW